MAALSLVLFFAVGVAAPLKPPMLSDKAGLDECCMPVPRRDPMTALSVPQGIIRKAADVAESNDASGAVGGGPPEVGDCRPADMCICRCFGVEPAADTALNKR